MKSVVRVYICSIHSTFIEGKIGFLFIYYSDRREELRLREYRHSDLARLPPEDLRALERRGYPPHPGKTKELLYNIGNNMEIKSHSHGGSICLYT